MMQTCIMVKIRGSNKRKLNKRKLKLNENRYTHFAGKGREVYILGGIGRICNMDLWFRGDGHLCSQLQSARLPNSKTFSRSDSLLTEDQHVEQKSFLTVYDRR